ncbi:hypothetical protein FHR83_009006 [Actinoplanes campanulatus]|uniref:Uncharacterized protein n=1 Tax=Actinoplanes campanulatus TaxID=113559 RepID=A0A7W5ARY0_9ACTN|nr:hypothetical protein [Actinoplanes campanulatus]
MLTTECVYASMLTTGRVYASMLTTGRVHASTFNGSQGPGLIVGIA